MDKSALEVAELVKLIERRRATHKLEYYKPYPYQVKFHHARSFGFMARQRALMAANQIGKTYCGAMEMAMHMTGQYPEWWQGTRYTDPPNCLVGSNTNETGRDICQKEMFGDPADPQALGTGTIPIDCVGKITRKAGVPNAIDSALVKHKKGWSKVAFRAYEQGPKKFMGHRYNVIWADEEPPPDIWSQLLRATFSTDGIIYITFTPEEGVTEVVSNFITAIKRGQVLIQAGWDDAPHMTTDKKEEKLAQIPEYEREMRTKGVPLMGSGLVWPVSESDLRIDPFEIPGHWPRVCGIDFGWDHPFAAVWIAWDRDSDKIYVYDCYREAKVTPPIHASAINSRGEWIPVVWPHDGLNTEKGSGTPLAEQYRDLHVNMMRNKFSNRPEVGKDEGTGGNSVEAGVSAILTRMQQDQFKVFSTLTTWFEEWRMYHRVDGKIVALRDDLMSATRYAAQSLRHAQTRTAKFVRPVIRVGARNW